MNRRDFIQHAAGLTGAAMLAPQLVGAVQDNTIFGQHERRYKLDKNWVKATLSGLPVNDCHEMVQDAQKRIILLTNETKNNIIIFNKDGKVLKTWGNEFPGGHGLSIIGEGSDQVLFITDTERHQFFKATLEGKIISSWNFPEGFGTYKEAKEFVPTETTITHAGDFYVADGYGSQFIMHYDEHGKIQHVFGGRGDKPWHLDNAHGICIDYRSQPETLIITDRTRCCFKRFTLKGEYIETIPLPGACVCRPVIKGDYLYAAVLRSPDLGVENSGFVIILNKENKPVSVIGGSEAAYDSNQQLQPFRQTIPLFKHPHDVLVDDDENLYVCQWSSGKVYPYKFIRV